MAYYLVRAKPRTERLSELRARLDALEIRRMRPFGTALDESLRGARLEADGTFVWEEQDYCTPPLAMEREAVLDTYFHDIWVERIEKNAGWAHIHALPSVWGQDAPSPSPSP